jgi:hypothetical protein
MTKQLRQYGRTTMGVGRTQIHDAITGCEDFHAGALRGESVKGYGHPGRLEGSARESFNASDGSLAYVIYSYATPIAWKRSDGAWFMPDDSYSVTTSRHQGIVRVALRHEDVK